MLFVNSLVEINQSCCFVVCKYTRLDWLMFVAKRWARLKHTNPQLQQYSGRARWTDIMRRLDRCKHVPCIPVSPLAPWLVCFFQETPPSRISVVWEYANDVQTGFEEKNLVVSGCIKSRSWFFSFFAWINFLFDIVRHTFTMPFLCYWIGVLVNANESKILHEANALTFHKTRLLRVC